MDTDVVSFIFKQDSRAEDMQFTNADEWANKR